MLTDLPSHVLQRIIEWVDRPSAAALVITCKDTHALVQERLNKERSRWKDLLSQAGTPFIRSSNFAERLDDILCRFVLSDAQTVDLPGLDTHAF
jgi:hypothetical protein